MSSGRKETAEERKARLAKALRANLRRRKAQARDRSAEGDKSPPTAESDDESED